jgi:hypothetical protein
VKDCGNSIRFGTGLNGLTTILSLGFAVTAAQAQLSVPMWTNSYVGPNGYNWATAMAVDDTGNVFVTGKSPWPE